VIEEKKSFYSLLFTHGFIEEENAFEHIMLFFLSPTFTKSSVNSHMIDLLLFIFILLTKLNKMYLENDVFSLLIKYLFNYENHHIMMINKEIEFHKREEKRLKSNRTKHPFFLFLYVKNVLLSKYRVYIYICRKKIGLIYLM
jgi:hypothetical protein